MISVTYIALLALKSNSGLTPGETYNISDRGIIISAIENNILSFRAERLMLCANHDTGSTVAGSKGKIWCPLYGNTYSIGDKVAWGGNIWINLTGQIGSSINEFWLDPVNWQLANIIEGVDYKFNQFYIDYDFENDLVISQFDKYGNSVGPVTLADVTSLGYNPCDYTDWLSFNNTYVVKNNSFTFGFFNNYSVIDLTTEISNNTDLTITNNTFFPYLAGNRISGNRGTEGPKAIKKNQSINYIVGNNVSEIRNNVLTDPTNNSLYIQGNNDGIYVFVSDNEDMNVITYNEGDLNIANCKNIGSVDYNKSLQMTGVSNLPSINGTENIQLHNLNYPSGSVVSNVKNGGNSITLVNTLSLNDIHISAEKFIYQYLEFKPPINNGVFKYFGGAFLENCHIVEAVIMCKGLTNNSSTLSFGVENSAPAYMPDTTVSALNAGPQKINTISGALNIGDRFYVTAMGNVGSSGTTSKIRIWVKLLKSS